MVGGGLHKQKPRSDCKILSGRAVKQSGGVPRKIRSDDGTENSVIEAMHTYLRSPGPSYGCSA